MPYVHCTMHKYIVHVQCILIIDHTYSDHRSLIYGPQNDDKKFILALEKKSKG